jgi:hypothetical protein
MCRRFGTLIFGVSRKNNWDQIARVFLQVKVWLTRSLSQPVDGLTRRGRVLVEEQAAEGKDPKFSPVV